MASYIIQWKPTEEWYLLTADGSKGLAWPLAEGKFVRSAFDGRVFSDVAPRLINEILTSTPVLELDINQSWRGRSALTPQYSLFPFAPPPSFTNSGWVVTEHRNGWWCRKSVMSIQFSLHQVIVKKFLLEITALIRFRNALPKVRSGIQRDPSPTLSKRSCQQF